MVSWQSAMLKGNECFDSRDWFEAEQHYYRAIELLDMLWQKCSDSIEAMQGWVCGYHNLAATFEQQGQLERAAHCLMHAHYTILNHANNDDVPGMAQSNALRMSSITYKSIVEFKKNHQNCAKCMSELSNGINDNNMVSHYSQIPRSIH